MLTIYHSNKTDLLKDILVKLIQRQPLSAPFAAEQILVQSQGMAQWLKLKLAEDLGICAGVEFPLPANFIWDTFQKTIPALPEHSPFDKAGLSWRLIPLLQDLPQSEENRIIRQYLNDDENGLKAYQLANQVADLFDHYLIYRPEWIYDWEQGGTLAAEQHRWQPALLRSVMQQLERGDQQLLHRADLFQQFFQLAEQGQLGNKLPERVFVFGIASFPPVYLKLLQQLGEVIDVHIMLTNPCRYYWGDIIDPVRQLPDSAWLDGLLARQRSELAQPEIQHPLLKPGINQAEAFTPDGELQSSNSLLASMGKLGRDAIWLLSDLNANEVEAFVEPESDSLLHTIQRDILELNPRGESLLLEPEQKQLVAADDDSLRVITCHSPMREIEILHDQLLDYFERHPQITPKDVVVMIPDIDRYAPFIQAVFGQQSSERAIPYSISDRSALSADPTLQSVLAVLALSLNRFRLSDILGLLELPAIQQRFELADSDIPQLKLWIDGAAIHWGLKPDTAAQAAPLNTWQDGIRRMLLGYAMGYAGIFESILPLDEVEGLSADAVGKLAALLAALEALLADIDQPKTASAWQQWSYQLLQTLYSDGLEFEPSLSQVRQAVDRLAEIHLRQGDQQLLGIEVFSSYLAQQLENRVVSQRFAAGRLNFCTLMPMRSLPFKLVCLIGMNDDCYPRTRPKSGFDLIAEQPRKGDRSRRDDDRYMFIEALIAAEEKLYISYIDRSVQDNSERFCSVLVSELLEYIEQGFRLENQQSVRDWLVQQHPLTPFSRDYFTDSQLFTYNPQWQTHTAESLPVANSKLPVEAESVSEIELQALLRFYRQPCEYFLTRRLGVYFSLEQQEIVDTEPFELNMLEQYLLKDQLLKTLLYQGDLEQLLQRLRLSGGLPFGEFGEQLLDGLYQQASKIHQLAAPLLTEKLAQLEVDLRLKPLSVSGWLDDYYGCGLVRIKPGKLNGRDMLRYGIEHLCLQLSASADQPRTTWLVANETRVKLKPLPDAEAKALLEQFLHLFEQGMQAPLPLFPKTAWKWQQTLLERGEQTAEKAAKQSYCGYQRGANSVPGEGEDRYIQRCFGSQWSPELLQHTQRYAGLLLAPLQNLQEEA